jgi:tetratricopeptide (TPR) repeat protein
MKKWFIPSIVLLIVLVGAVLITIWISIPSELPAAIEDEDVCAQYGIKFDRSSVINIYQNPDLILDDPEIFWAEDLAYQLVAMAPWYRGKSTPPDGWDQNIQSILTLSDEEREEEKPFARSIEIIEHADTFCQNALPIILSLLPEDADLSTTVHLAAFTDPPYFAFRSNIVMNTDVRSYFGKTSKFFSLLGHEIFHIGYFDFQPYQTEVWSDFYPTKVLLTTLQNDGLAVYTQYLLSSYYPAPAEIELLLLENKFAVNILIDRVNDLLRETSVISEDEIMSKIFSGTNQRALYVVGAHMARTIAENLGRDVLVQTIAEGPRSFIATYNKVVKNGSKVYEIPEPEELSALQVLRQAAILGNLDVLVDTISAISTVGIENPGGETFEHLTSTGLLLLKNELSSIAVIVFQLQVSLFPDHPYSYLHLGNAYTQNGDVDKAREAYVQALEIDPRVAPAVNQ